MINVEKIISVNVVDEEAYLFITNKGRILKKLYGRNGANSEPGWHYFDITPDLNHIKINKNPTIK